MIFYAVNISYWKSYWLIIRVMKFLQLMLTGVTYMKKLNKKIIIAVILVFLCTSGLILIRSIFQRVSIQPKAEGDAEKGGTKNHIRDYSTFKGLNMDTDSIKIRFEGNDLNLTLPVYVHINRYYMPLTEIMDKTGGTILQDGGSIKITSNNRSANIDTALKTISAGGKEYKLKGDVILSDGITYITMMDLVRALDLKTDWDLNKKTISFFYNRGKNISEPSLKSGKAALLRLEDITAAYGGGDHYTDADKLEKLRIVSDYIYCRGVPFHIAWVPRYIDPRRNSKQDNDLSNKYSMYNADFLFTLDYMLDRNGIAGLHGYTHQYGNSISIGGTEFGDKATSSNQYAEDRIKLAISAAKKLNIPYAFFEVPHYWAAPNQFIVMEKYFDTIYEHYPGIYSHKAMEVKSGDRIIKYIPAPLEYIRDRDDVAKMPARLDSLGSNGLGSFFYHPWLEFQDIKITRDASGYPSYAYSDSSILHQLFKVFESKGYKFVSIHDINGAYISKKKIERSF